MLEEDDEEEDATLEKIRKVQRDLEEENETEREIDLGETYFDKTMKFCKLSENDLTVVEGFKVHQAIVFVHEDITRIDNLFDSL